MELEAAARGFAAMGSEARLRVLNTLVRAGEGGLTVGDIQDRTGIAPSTLAHHLKFLSAAGLLIQERDGRTIVNRADFPHLDRLAGFILDECCADARPKAANNG
tara:strand:+ start:744 stop:1055 length:312 start_codon:yes stop_codon:yes gene_type:complete